VLQVIEEEEVVGDSH